MTDTLIKGEMTVKVDTNIKSNVSGKNIYETNGNLSVDDANMKFTENIVNRNKDYSQSIVKLNEAGKKIELKGVGSIEITDNKFVVEEKGTDKTKKLSALDLSSEETSIASGNRNEGEEKDDITNHVYGVAKKETGFVIQTANTKIQGSKTVVENIIFDTDDGIETIYKDWTKTNVASYSETLFRKAWTADDTINLVERRMKGNDIIIDLLHAHKLCGIKKNEECEHAGITEHMIKNKGIATYSNLLNIDTFPTNGAYYLGEDIERENELVTLTEDLYLCLNFLI